MNKSHCFQKKFFTISVVIITYNRSRALKFSVPEYLCPVMEEKIEKRRVPRKPVVFGQEYADSLVIPQIVITQSKQP